MADPSLERWTSGSPPRLWEVVISPVERGLVVQVTDGRVRSVVGRVAWIPTDATFPRLRSLWRWDKLREVVARAEAEADRLNGGQS